MLSEVQLLQGAVRVDAGATITASVAPLSGSLAALSDGLTTAAVVLARETVLHWDFGTPTGVNNIALGAGSSAASFPYGFRVECSDDDAMWAQFDEGLEWVAFPGAYALTPNVSRGNWIRSLTTRSAGSVSESYNADFSVATMVSAGDVSKFRALPYRGAGPKQVEFKWVAVTGSNGPLSLGFAGRFDAFAVNRVGSNGVGDGFGYYVDGRKSYQGGLYAYGATFDLNDVIGAVLDRTAGTVEFFKNGVSQGVAFTNVNVDAVGEPIGEIWPAAITLSTGTWSIQIKTKDFDFPVAGAAPWTDITVQADPGLFTAAFVAGAPERTLIAGGESASTDLSKVYGVDHYEGRKAGSPYGQDFGVGYIRNTVKKKSDPVNLPLRRRVRLFTEFDGRLIAETWSDAVTGEYEFLYLDPAARYTVISYDHEHNFRAAIADNLTATVDA